MRCAHDRKNTGWNQVLLVNGDLFKPPSEKLSRVTSRSRKFKCIFVANIFTILLTGDLFEKEEDLKDETIWMVSAYSEAPKLQETNRNKMILRADYIVPGHGPMFKVTKEMKENVSNPHNYQHYI